MEKNWETPPQRDIYKDKAKTEVQPMSSADTLMNPKNRVADEARSQETPAILMSSREPGVPGAL